MLAEDARQRAMDTSDTGRHLALIGLDGACEYAIWLAARSHGVSVKRANPSFPEQYGALKAALNQPRWEPQGWPGVEQLHRARNDAQHSAIAPDPNQLPIWTDAAWAFIDSLCRAAFRVPLDKILLAEAVRDSELNGYIRWSEETLSAEPAQALDLALTAFDGARSKWRLQQDLSEFSPPAIGPLERPHPLQGAQGKFRELDALLEVQPFATDIGEYFWLRRARQEFESAEWPPTVEDARRALLFVTNWIVRWEIFTNGYPDDQWEVHREAIEPPKVDGTKITVRGAQAELLHEVPGQGARRVATCFSLANVPNRGQPPWGELLGQALADGAREAGTAGLFLQVNWNFRGTLEVQTAVASNPGSVGAIVKAAVDLAVARYDECVSKSQHSEQDRQQIETAFHDVLISARSDLAFFADVTVVRDEWLNTGGWIVFIHFDSATAEEVSHAAGIFHDAARTLPKVHLRDGRIAFQACEITEATERGFRDAVERSETEVRHLRTVRTEQQQIYRDFAIGIREQFGGFPADG